MRQYLGDNSTWLFQVVVASSSDILRLPVIIKPWKSLGLIVFLISGWVVIKKIRFHKYFTSFQTLEKNFNKNIIWSWNIIMHTYNMHIYIYTYKYIMIFNVVLRFFIQISSQSGRFFPLNSKIKPSNINLNILVEITFTWFVKNCCSSLIT